jgi:signal transduction histidine kinase
MSNTLSSAPPTSSTAADSDAIASINVAPEDVLAAGDYLARRSVYGLVWLDPELTVLARLGRLVRFVATGQHIASSLLPLFGLDDEIHALRETPGEVFDLPAVTLMSGSSVSPRLNLTVFWLEKEQRYLVLVARATPRSEVDDLLAQQTRLRLIAEAENMRQKRELERANGDLEQYASIISHDLKAPLRGMRYLADDISAALESGETVKAQSLLEELRQQSRRMSGMMTALLDYASVGRKAEAVEDVDTRSLVENVVRSLAARPGFEIAITGHWPRLQTVAAPLDLVLRNLIDNAIKHHDGAAGDITIHCVETARGLNISVADDGPGIAPELHAAALLPFRRLGSPAQNAPDGHGMGLAFVKRTVESLGGTLSLHSNPAEARGTEVRIFWPREIISL